MRTVILHDTVSEESAPDEKDVLVQAAAVKAALEHLGHETVVFACDLDLSALIHQISDTAPDVVFNLVESLGRHGALIHLVPFLLEAYPVVFTGAPADAMMATSNKLMAKTLLLAAGLPTPAWAGPFPATTSPLLKTGPPQHPREKPWIIKSVWEHASIGLDEDGIVYGGSTDALLTEMKRRAKRMGGACFAEVFIPGREFNLSVLDGPDGPTVLPPAEIVFEGYGPDKPRIVGYRAKWDPDAYEYTHTPRCFDFPPHDRPLLAALEETALAAWRCLGLKGYARVDFRVDADLRPWILEVNANPCLSPDAGFAAALERAGIPFPVAVDRILGAAAVQGNRR